MGKNLKKGEVAVSFRRKLMALKWTVCDKKGGEKQKLKVCIDYSDAMGGVGLSDQ
jgi:hypothetical protein